MNLYKIMFETIRRISPLLKLDPNNVLKLLCFIVKGYKCLWKNCYMLTVQIYYFFSLASRNSSATVRSDDSASSDAAERLREALTAFDEKLRRQRPSVDKALLKSAYHQSLLRVSWNLIEAEILHTPGTPFLIQSNCVDNFQ